MKQGIKNISTAISEPNTYLAVELTDDAQVQSFCIDMAMRNKVTGLLPLSRQFINGTEMLYYDVTGMRTLSSILNSALRTDAVLPLLRNMVDTFFELPEYFMHSTQCLIDLDYIYSSIHGNPGFALVPMKQDSEDGGEELKRLFSDIIGRCTSRSNQNVYAPLLTCLIRPVFDLTEFSEILNAMMGRTAPPPSAMPNGNKPIAHRKVDTPENKQMAPNIPAPPAPQNISAPPKPAPVPSPHGFAIPGGGKVVENSKSEKEKPAKKASIFGKKKEKALTSSASLLYNGQSISLNKSQFVIGREGCDFNIGDMRVSQPHATIIFDGSTYSIRDEGSLNFTFVNGRQVGAHATIQLADGAEIQMGPAAFMFKQ